MVNIFQISNNPKNYPSLTPILLNLYQKLFGKVIIIKPLETSLQLFQTQHDLLLAPTNNRTKRNRNQNEKRKEEKKKKEKIPNIV